MEPTPKPTPSTWHCVLDRHMRQIYLGTDEAEARKVAVEGSTMRSAERMGDAMLEAAVAYGTQRRR